MQFTPRFTRSLAFPLIALALQSASAAVQVQVDPIAFPLVPTRAFAEKGIEMRFDPDLRFDLERSGRHARIEGVQVPTATGFDAVALDLTRLSIVTDDFQYWVDGSIAKDAGQVREELSIWFGSVSGEVDSDVYLAFSPSVAFGWIQRAGGTAHLFGVDDPAGGFEAGLSALVHESDPALAGPRPGFLCETRLPDGMNSTAPSMGSSHAAGTLVEALVAVETDYEFYQLFNNLQVAGDYALALWGAISVRYQASANTHVRLPYLALYTNASDPWITTTAGGRLDELRTAWSNNIPNGGDLGHMTSGANLGGGVAYLDVLCNGAFAFGVSGNLAGQTPFPIPTTGALNWDFYVSAHELGHNFGSPHTHDFCPTPLDECAPSGSFGSCQSQQVCVLGSIMSYCHLCPGGVANVEMDFHPTVSALLTSEAAGATCLGACSDCDQPPFVSFTASPASGPAPLISTFTSTAIGEFDSLLWDFGDGTTSTVATTGHGYAFPGTYTVTLSADWSGGTVTHEETDLIVVGGGTVASATERNGSGTNPSIFSTVTLPVLGTDWISAVDAQSVGATGLSFVFGLGRALPGIPTVFGEFLIDPTSDSLVTSISLVSSGTATHTESVPNDTSLLGLPVYTQAFLNGSGILTNAIDLILGT